MRNCPHCNNEIQDEAVFCRFCRTEVDPPLWMTSLVKCTYCAEWIERGIELCPLCGKALNSEQPFSVELDPASDNEAEDFLARLRSSELPEPEESAEAKLEEPDSTPAFYESDSEPQESEPDSLYAERESQPIHDRSDTAPDRPAFQPVEHDSSEIRTPSEPIEQDRSIKRTPSQPQDEGIAVLHNRRLDYASDFEHGKEHDTQPEESEASFLQTFMEGPWLRWVSISVAVLAFGVTAFFLYPSVRDALATIVTPSPGSPFAAAESATPTTISETPTNEAITGTGIQLLPTPKPTERNCYSWDEITLEMAGQTICAFGDLKRWFRVDEIPYVAIFSEELGTFAIIDREVTYPDYAQGTCITTTGEVEVMRGTRPFIEVQGDLETCDE